MCSCIGGVSTDDIPNKIFKESRIASLVGYSLTETTSSILDCLGERNMYGSTGIYVPWTRVEPVYEEDSTLFLSLI